MTGLKIKVTCDYLSIIITVQAQGVGEKKVIDHVICMQNQSFVGNTTSGMLLSTLYYALHKAIIFLFLVRQKYERCGMLKSVQLMELKIKTDP